VAVQQNIRQNNRVKKMVVRNFTPDTFYFLT
jgi:hypothetical protein